jgi:two-component system, cell cycle sensor histidine kinase and response regulator CckA
MSRATRCTSAREAGLARKTGRAAEPSTGTPRETPAASPEGAGCAEDADAADASGLTILVADDEPGIRTHVGEVLQRLGYRVLEAADGVEALELAARHAGPIHLLLTDISMPRLDGRELDRRLSHQRPETRTLFMSGSAGAALHPGAAFLPKPFALPSLVRKVSEVLRVHRGGGSQRERFR